MSKRESRFNGLNRFGRLKDLFSGNLLLPAGLAGLLLSLVLGWAFVYFSLAGDTGIYPEAQRPGSPFRRELEKYDSFLPPALKAVNHKNIEKRLARLEKLAGTQEEWLSVLKRGRSLAGENLRFLPVYRNAVNKAVGEFPHSEPLLAVALEAAFLGGETPPFTPEADSQAAPLEFYAAELNLSRFANLLLSYHVLSGAFASPFRAVSVPGVELFLPEGLSALPLETQKDLKTDEVLLRILLGDDQETPLLIGRLLAEEPQNKELRLLGAEYFYDYGSPLKSASLFSGLGGDFSLSREADALFLAGETDAARNIWTALASPPVNQPGPQGEIAAEIRLRSLYNLAATAKEEKEEIFWLEKLFASRELPLSGEVPEAAASQAELFGVIRYTRLQDASRSVAILEESLDAALSPAGDAVYSAPGIRPESLVDLELFRRLLDSRTPERRTAEVWMLLGRRPDDEELCRWAAVYFDRQKLYGESAQLLKIAVNQKFEGDWFFFHMGLAHIREGNLEAGEKLLRDALAAPRPGSVPQWIIHANLGRIYESRRSISAALEHYETAATLAENSNDNTGAAAVQLRLSRCLEASGRIPESREALERAAGLDPSNLNVRLELGRLNAAGTYSD